MIWNREEYIEHCTFGHTEREMFCELFGPLVGLEEQWKMQGATKEELEMVAFDWDYVKHIIIPAKCNAITGIIPHVIEETPEYTISVDNMGRTAKLCKGSATIPLPQSHPVTCMDDWLKIKHWYKFSENRVNTEDLCAKKLLHDVGYLTVLFVPGAFDEPRQLMGEEALCYAYYEEPELIEDMISTISETVVKVIERVGSSIPIDNIMIHEDMAGKSGPLLGPNLVNEFMAPYYKKIWDAARNYGAKIFSQDSDGDMNPLIQTFADCGVNLFYPCEPAAGMDIVELRKKYGRTIAFKGGIDKHVLRQDKESIRKELEYKMQPLMLGGGTVFALDHRIPNGVPLDNYRYYVDLGRELLGLPPISEYGWQRMAF